MKKLFWTRGEVEEIMRNHHRKIEQMSKEYKDGLTTVAKGHDDVCRSAMNIINNLESDCDVLRTEVFETNARYGVLLRKVRQCVEDKKYKALKEYVEAYDRGEMFLMSDETEAVDEITELTDDQLKAIMEA